MQGLPQRSRESLPHQPRLRCPARPSCTPQRRSSQRSACPRASTTKKSTEAPVPVPRSDAMRPEPRSTCPRALKRRSGGRTTPAQWRAQRSDEELHLEEHSEEPGVWEVSFPMATWLPVRGCQSRSQIAAIDAARLRVASSRQQPPRCPSARRTTQGSEGRQANS